MNFLNPQDKDFYLGRVLFVAPAPVIYCADYADLEPRVFAIVYRKPNMIPRRVFLKNIRKYK